MHDTSNSIQHAYLLDAMKALYVVFCAPTQRREVFQLIYHSSGTLHDDAMCLTCLWLCSGGRNCTKSE